MMLQVISNEILTMSRKFISLLDTIRDDIHDDEYVKLYNSGLETHRLQKSYEKTYNEFRRLCTSFDGHDLSDVVKCSGELNSIKQSLVKSTDNTHQLLVHVLNQLKG